MTIGHLGHAEGLIVHAVNLQNDTILIETVGSYAVIGIDRFCNEADETVPKEHATRAEFTIGHHLLDVPLASNLGEALFIGVDPTGEFFK